MAAQAVASLALLLLSATASLQLASANPAPDTGTTPKEDCQILAAIIASDDRGLRAAASTNLLSPRSYGVDCDWAPTGITVASPDDRNHWLIGFGKPVYSAGRDSAEVEYNAFFPFRGAHTFHCTLNKSSGHWNLSSCRMGMIVD